ncbi:MAG: autotransporter-associated beta strand repeat-containing protein [Planctomycetota bacterium]|nr:autotransporter-associated beta strand repeat-containing protein [Planctomycetota bacterium]
MRHLRRKQAAAAVVAAAVLAVVLFAGPSQATDSTWVSTTSGSWNDPTKWSNGVPNGIDDIARLTGGSASRTLYIDSSSVTLGSLYYGAPGTYSTEVQSWAGIPLIFDTSAGNALIDVQGSFGILAPLVLNRSLTVNSTLTNGGVNLRGAVSSGVAGTGITFNGPGNFYLSARNTYSGATIINGGQLRALDGVNLPAASNLTLAGGGILSVEYSATFNRSLGTGPGQVQWTGSGGFSQAGGGTLAVNLGGQATPTTLVWGVTPGFVPDGCELNLGAQSGSGSVNFQNPIDLGGTVRTIRGDNTSSAGIISGGLSNGGLTKVGTGNIQVTGACTYTGQTTVKAGSLGFTGALSPASSIVIDGGSFLYYGGGTIGPITLLSGSLAGPTVAAASYDFRSGSVPAILSGASDVVKTTSGTVTMSGDNQHSGKNDIREGVMSFTDWLASARTGASTVVADGATLEWKIPTGNSNTWSEATIIRGMGVGGTGALRHISGAVTCTAPVTLAADAAIGGDYAWQGGLNITGVVGGPGGLTKVGTNIISLGCNNTYEGSTTIAGGALRAADGVGLVAGSNLIFSGGMLEGDGTTSFSRPMGAGPGQVRFTGSGGFSAYGGKFTANLGGQPTPDTLVWGAGDFLPDGAQLLLNTRSATGEVELRNPIDLGGGVRSILVTDNSNSTTDLATLSGGLSNGGITKEGDGTLVLTAAGSYTGPTTVNNGTLRCTVSGALGAGSSIVINKATQGTTTLDLGTTNQTAGSLTLVDGSVTGSTAALTVTGNVDASKGLISAGLAGTAGLTKTTSSTVTLSGTNTYTGATIISAGTLLANQYMSLSPNSNLVLAGGVLEGNNFSFTRSLGTGPGQVQWTGAGGFAAYGGKLTVNIGGNATPDTLVWGSPFFVPDGANMVFGSTDSTQTVEFANPIDMAGGTRTIAVTRGSYAYSTDLANLTGAISNGALTKTGPGTLLT